MLDILNGLKRLSRRLRSIKLLLRRLASSSNADWLSRSTPFSSQFGFDRGDPIDRRYIERFLLSNKSCIVNDVAEIGDRQYTLKYATSVVKSFVLTADDGGVKDSRTFVVDLADAKTLQALPRFDCIIATNVLNFIYDAKAVVRGLALLLKDDSSCILLTVAGSATPVSLYDYHRWGDYWRFTDQSLYRLFSEYFEDVEIVVFGNAPLAAAFIMGLSCQEVPSGLFEVSDPAYQVVLGVKASSPRTALQVTT